MPINEDTPPKWEDTQPVEDTPPKWEDTQPIEQESSLGVVGKYIPDFLNPLAMSEEERAKIKAQTPWQAVKHATADAVSTASTALPMPGAKGLLWFAARTGTAAATSGVDKALHNVADDKPVMGDVGTSALIGGGVNAGIEAAIAAAVKGGGLAFKGGKWVMNQAADAITGHKLTQEMLDSPLVQEIINKLVSLKGALGIGKGIKGRAGDVADEAATAYERSIQNIPDTEIPITEVLPTDSFRYIDTPNTPELRPKLPSHEKKILSSLETQQSKVARQEAEAGNQLQYAANQEATGIQQGLVKNDIQALQALKQERLAAAAAADAKAAQEAEAAYQATKQERKAAAAAADAKALQEARDAYQAAKQERMAAAAAADAKALQDAEDAYQAAKISAQGDLDSVAVQEALGRKEIQILQDAQQAAMDKAAAADARSLREAETAYQGTLAEREAQAATRKQTEIDRITNDEIQPLKNTVTDLKSESYAEFKKRKVEEYLADKLPQTGDGKLNQALSDLDKKRLQRIEAETIGKNLNDQQINRHIGRIDKAIDGERKDIMSLYKGDTVASSKKEATSQLQKEADKHADNLWKVQKERRRELESALKKKQTLVEKGDIKLPEEPLPEFKTPLAINQSKVADEFTSPILDKTREVEDYIKQRREAAKENIKNFPKFEAPPKTQATLPKFEAPPKTDLTNFPKFEAPPKVNAQAVREEFASKLRDKQAELANIRTSSGTQIDPIPVPQTTVRDAYRVSNMEVGPGVNVVKDVMQPNLNRLGGESITAADLAGQNSDTLTEVAKSIPSYGGTLDKVANMMRWGGRVASFSHPASAMAWAAGEIASNPELRYVLGRNLEALGKWSPKLQDAYNNGGAKAVNVLVNTLNQTDPEFRQAHAGNQQVSPYQEGAEKPQIRKPELSRDDFLKNLSGVESGGKYDATNPNSSATGKYQFLWKIWGDDVSRWAGYPVSQQMFLSNPKLQDLYMKDHHDTTLMRDAKTLRDSSPNASKRSDTELKALIHFKGLAGARKYLDKGIDDTSANNIGVEAYLKRVGGG